MDDDERSTGSKKGRAAPDHGPTRQYEIRVKGHLGTRWTTWFDGMALAATDDGTTVISGPVIDQAALHGLLQKLRDLGLELISLVDVTTDEPTTTVPNPTNNIRSTS